MKLGSTLLGNTPTVTTRLRLKLVHLQAANAEHKYVLCLDDDVTVHQRSLQMLVEALETDDSAFMATGVYCHSQLGM